MSNDFRLVIEDVFRFQDGRTVFAGVVDEPHGYIGRGTFELVVDGELRGGFLIEGEMLAAGGDGSKRAVSTTDVRCVDRAFLEGHEIVLRPADPSKRRGAFVMHRHLLGVESPPAEYLADPMTQAPILPEGWDGDAWVGPRGRGYFLRAWNKQVGLVAYGRGPTYEAARRAILDQVADGGRRIEINPSDAETFRANAN